jgi:hypothetical protein
MKRQINDNQYLTGRANGKDTVIEYFTNDDKRHREDGPSMLSHFNATDSYYLDWWQHGKLVGTFDGKKGIMKRTDNDTFTGLYEVEVPEKWKGLEQTLSLYDVGFCNKPTLPNIIPTYVDVNGHPAIALAAVEPNYETALADTKTIQNNIEAIRKSSLPQSSNENMNKPK